jgi:trimeric autotransporter adhesin
MKIKFIAVCKLVAISTAAYSQSVGIGTTAPHASSQLEISSTTKGLLIPRMSTTAITSVSNPAKGLMVYDSTQNQLLVNMGTSGIPSWQTVVAKSGWALNGNNGTNASTHFIGTTDNQSLIFKINNGYAGKIDAGGSVAIGRGALLYNPSSIQSVALGDSALFYNGIGPLTGESPSVGNTAVGYKSLFYNNTGQVNTATGYHSLYKNITGSSNTANGSYSLYSNTGGTSNTASGYASLFYNSSGANNTANGSNSLQYNLLGNGNTANGCTAMFNNTYGNYNTANGFQALYSNTTGEYNTAIGEGALFNTSGSSYNTMVGAAAGSYGNQGWNNTYIGSFSNAYTDGIFNSIAIGNYSSVSASNQVRIGNISTNSIGGFANWSNVSDGRVKKNIQNNVPGLSFITRLQPVTYNLDLDAADRIMQRPPIKDTTGKIIERKICNDEISARIAKQQLVYSGFIAQDVEKVAKAIGYNFSGVDAAKNAGDLYGLRYAEFVVPLVKAVQEQQQLIEALQKENSETKEMISKLQKQITALEVKQK